MPRRKRVAVFSTEAVTGCIGGLGIRQLEVARALSRKFDVKLFTMQPSAGHKEKFAIETLPDYSAGTVEKHFQWADSICATRPKPDFLMLAGDMKKPVAIDLFASLYFESMEAMRYHKGGSTVGSVNFTSVIERLRVHLSAGDFFLCANQHERDYYLGILTSLGKLRPDIYKKDMQFKSVIDEMPFGISRKDPKRGEPILRGVIPGIGDKDFVIISSGSLWKWYDYRTPVNAMARLKKDCPRAKLVFIGVKHPAEKRQVRIYYRLKDYAKRKGVLDKNVFIYNEWVPYNQRERYLTEADAGMAIFSDHMENRFSFRIRVADYLWANLPVFTNPGNALSDFVRQKEIGFVSPFGGDAELASQIKWLATRPARLRKIKEKTAEAKKVFYWDRAIKPLERFCANPRKVKPLFKEDLLKLSFYDFNRMEVRRVLFLRSSPMEHAIDAVRSIRKAYPDAKIDMVVQPRLKTAPFGEGLNFIRMPGEKFRPDMAFKMTNDKRIYDAVVCSFSEKNINFYKNVIEFASMVHAKRRLAFNHEYRFADIGPLCESVKKKGKGK